MQTPTCEVSVLELASGSLDGTGQIGAPKERESVLADTAGWNRRSTAKPDREIGIARVSRQHDSDDRRRSWKAFSRWLFGNARILRLSEQAFEVTSHEWADPDGLPPDVRTFVGRFPRGACRDLRLTRRRPGPGACLDTTVGSYPNIKIRSSRGWLPSHIRLPDNELDVAFSEIVSRDGLRTFDDFRYEDVGVRSDGTYRQSEITGAFFGSSNEEVAGYFDSNDPKMLGSFGARRVPEVTIPDQEEVDTALAGIVETAKEFRIGEDVAPPVDRFTGQSDFNGATISSFTADENEDLSAEDMGPWNNYSFHLRGDLEFVGGAAAFGIAHGDESVEPWALGPKPLADLANNNALSGTISWNGALLGVGNSDEIVSGKTHMFVEIATLQGKLHFTGLEQWGEEVTPGEIGTGTIWGDGDLEYSISVHGNYFLRTNGDDGAIAGSFFGGSHQAAAGVLERSDLRAGFGGTR